MSQTRRLAAILAADVAGYSRLIGADEEGTLERLKALRRELLDPKIAEHQGRIVKTTGDGLLVEFASVVDAVRCARRGAARDGRAQCRRTPPTTASSSASASTSATSSSRTATSLATASMSRLGSKALAEPGGICVSARVQEDAAGRLDLTFEDIGEQSLKNIARPVRVYRVRLAAAETAPKSRRPQLPALALPDKPSIAVLPFANMSGDPEQEYFADGMVEEIITALSRIRWLFVIARNSTSPTRASAVDVKQVGRELGVRYVLEGSVRKGGNRVRITAQLIDALTGTHLWADRFDGSLEDVFELQDKIAVSVAGVIEPTLQAAEMRRSAARPTSDLTAYDLYLRALRSHLPDNARADSSRLWDCSNRRSRSIPDYGPALSWAAICHRRLAIDGWAKTGNRCKAIDFARQALRGGAERPRHPCQRRLRAGVFRRGHRRHDRAGRPRAGAQPELRPRLASAAAFSGSGPANPISRSSMSKPRCG